MNLHHPATYNNVTIFLRPQTLLISCFTTCNLSQTRFITLLGKFCDADLKLGSVSFHVMISALQCSESTFEFWTSCKHGEVKKVRVGDAVRGKSSRWKWSPWKSILRVARLSAHVSRDLQSFSYALRLMLMILCISTANVSFKHLQVYIRIFPLLWCTFLDIT